MTDISEIIRETDLSTKQRLFFYELCKLGVVQFNLNNPAHLKVLTQIVNKVANELKNADHLNESEEVQLKIKNRNDLNLLIVLQLLKNSSNRS